jgi:hypothetical protein
MTEPTIHWISAHDWIEAKPNQFNKQFNSSRPKPRNKAMGFRGKDRKIETQTIIDKITK